jgi:excisionase family DNA binding protein
LPIADAAKKWTSMNDGTILTVPETAEILRVSKNTAYELVRQRRIPAIRLGRRILVPRHELENWITNEARTIGAGNGDLADVR